MLMTQRLANHQNSRLSGNSAKTCPNIMLTIRLCIPATIITVQMNRRSLETITYWTKTTLGVIRLTSKSINLVRTELKALVLFRLLTTNSHLQT